MSSTGSGPGCEGRRLQAVPDCNSRLEAVAVIGPALAERVDGISIGAETPECAVFSDALREWLLQRPDNVETAGNVLAGVD